MAIDQRVMTPTQVRRHFRTVRQHALYGVPRADTYNSVVCTQATQTDTGSRVDRWPNISYAAAADQAAHWNFGLPPDYIAGTDIRIDFAYAKASSTEFGNIVGRGMGLSGANKVPADEPDMEYFENTINAPGVIDEVAVWTDTFDGTLAIAGDVVTYILYHRAIAGLQAIMSVHSVTLHYEAETYGR